MDPDRLSPTTSQVHACFDQMSRVIVSDRAARSTPT
jgi:hypothetical protein